MSYRTASAKVLSDELRRKISYVQVPLEQIRQANEDLALMFQWFERIGTGVDVEVYINSIQKSIGLHSRIGSNLRTGKA